MMPKWLGVMKTLQWITTRPTLNHHEPLDFLSPLLNCIEPKHQGLILCFVVGVVESQLVRQTNLSLFGLLSTMSVHPLLVDVAPSKLSVQLFSSNYAIVVPKSSPSNSSLTCSHLPLGNCASKSPNATQMISYSARDDNHIYVLPDIIGLLNW